jgi:hypothetical protein
MIHKYIDDQATSSAIQRYPSSCSHTTLMVKEQAEKANAHVNALHID